MAGIELDKCASDHEMSNQQSVKARSYVVSRMGHLLGLLNSPKTQMINGIVLVVFPYPVVQVSL